jgi:hypothetical protein
MNACALKLCYQRQHKVATKLQSLTYLTHHNMSGNLCNKFNYVAKFTPTHKLRHRMHNAQQTNAVYENVVSLIST